MKKNLTHKKIQPTAQDSKTWYWGILLCIMVVAAFLRLWKLGSVPVSLYWDEIAMLVDVKSVVATGMDMHARPWYQLIYPSYGDYKLPVYIWFASLLGTVLSPSAFSLRLVSVIAGLVTCVIAAKIAGKLFASANTTQTRVIELFTCLVVALSPWSIHFSRTAFEGHLAQSIVALSIFVLLFFPHSKKAWGLSSLLGAIAVYTYFSVRFVWPVIFVAVCIHLFMQSQQKTENRSLKRSVTWWLTPLACLALFGALLAPMTRADFYSESNQIRYSTPSLLNQDTHIHQANELIEYSGNSRVSRTLFHRGIILFGDLVNHYSDHVSLSFLFLTGDPNLRHSTTNHGLFLLAFFPFFIWGLTTLFHDKKTQALVLITWWLIALLPASIPATTPHSLRSLNALVPLSIIIGLGMSQAYAVLLKQPHKKMGTAVALLCAVAVACQSLGFTWYYFSIYPQSSALEWQAGQTELAEYVLRHKDSVSTVHIQNPEGLGYLWFLAQEYYPGGVTQQWKSDNFRFQTPDIKIVAVSDPSNPKSLIIVPSSEADHFVEKTKISVYKKETFSDSTNQVHWTALWTE